MKLTGYAATTETPYDIGSYTETLARGVFRQTLANNPDVQLLVNHDGMPLARTKSGTMRLTEDHKGLAVDADLDDDDPDVQLLVRKLQRGDLDQMSFAFVATDQKWNSDYTERRILAADINRGDCSIVNQGANSSTSVSVRSFGRRGAGTLKERKALAQALGNKVELRSARLSVERDALTVVRRRTTFDYRLTRKRQDQLVRASMSRERRAQVLASVMPDPYRRQVCPMCGGAGRVDAFGEGLRYCKNCDGSGYVNAVPDNA